MLKLLPILLLTSCASTWDCRDYGVQLGKPGVLRAINELPDSEIETICGTEKSGCVKNGHVYYRTSDECAFRHELCHVMNGNRHTVKYHQSILANRSTCP